tara:strand:- start:155 stop:1594 length:1440 start_codon:yes stop_codon:yes gene_type:complete
MLNGNRSEVFSYPYNSDAVTFNGTVVAPAFQGNLNGTVNTASQPNITGVGTLSLLSVSGAASPINLTHTSGHCVSLNRGSKSLNINANYAGQNNYAHIAMTSGMDIRWQLGGADRFSFKSDGHIEPLNNNQLNLGSDTTRFKNIYAKGTVTGVNISGRNLINNGAMQISQRSTSASISGTGTTFVLDRWAVERTAAGTAVITMSQDNQAPEGFSKSLKIDVTTADTSLGTGERWQVRTRIEAQNLKQLKYGTSNAKQMIISFFVRSNVTGTFTVGLYQADGNKVNSGNYTINSANTWEQKTVIINGNTVNAMTMDASLGIQIGFGIGVGTGFSGGTATGNWSTTNNTQYASQTNLLASTDNELFITGVQAEVGNVATEFEHKSYGQDLAECQRYYEENNCTWAGYTAAAQGNGSLQVDYKVAKRATPTLSTKTAATGVQNLTSQNLQDATLDRFVVDTRINTSGYGRFYDLLAASDAEL